MASRTQMIRWLPKPEEQDYPAAFSYLKLHFAPKRSRALVKELEAARVTEFKAKNDIVGAAGKTIVDQQIVELRTQLTKARSQLSDASPSEKQILATSIQNLEVELKTALSKLRASNKALINLRMLESGVQTLRAFYDGLMRRAAEYNCAL